MHEAKSVCATTTMTTIVLQRTFTLEIETHGTVRNNNNNLTVYEL